ncbi:MAG TPA: hypothetical protein PLV68_15695, partial [Ilumatobacteraceae bacterium]|nr:hypothetical protein [Ilumatobacteraceae bacterium]
FGVIWDTATDGHPRPASVRVRRDDALRGVPTWVVSGAVPIDASHALGADAAAVTEQRLTGYGWTVEPVARASGW